MKRVKKWMTLLPAITLFLSVPAIGKTDVQAEGRPGMAESADSLWLVGREGNGNYTISDDNRTLGQDGWDGTAGMFDPVEGSAGFVIGYGLTFTSETVRSIIGLRNNDGTWLLMRLIRNAGGTLSLSLQLWDNSGAWQTYFGADVPCAASDLQVQFIRRAGSDEIEWRITGTEDGVLYSSEIFSQKDFTAPAFLDGLLTLSIGGESEGSCVFYDPYIGSGDSYLAASIAGKTTVPAGAAQEYAISLSDGQSPSSCRWKLEKDGGAVASGSGLTFSCTFPSEGSYLLRAEAAGSGGTAVRTAMRIEAVPAGEAPGADPMDLRSEPFGTILYVTDTGGGQAWQPIVTELTGLYQKSAPAVSAGSFEDASSRDTADLTVILHGESLLSDAVPAADFEAAYDAFAAGLAGRLQERSVVVLMNIPALGRDTEPSFLDLHAEYNDAIRQIALKYGFLCADAFSSTSAAPWTRGDPDILAGAVIAALAPRCTALTASSRIAASLCTSYAPAPATDAQNAAAAATARTAGSADALLAALTDPALRLDLSLFKRLTPDLQAKAASELLAGDRSAWTGTAEIQKAFSRNVYAIRMANPETDHFTGPFKTMAVAGDSISEGVGATSPASTCWVSIVHRMIRDAQDAPLTLLNKAISGTLMTGTAGSFAPAIDRVMTDIVDNSPDLLFIAYGFNDQSRNVSVETFGSVYRQYIDTVREHLPDIAIVLVGLTYARDDSGSGRIRAYNDEIRAIALEYGLPYADVYTALYGSNWLLFDGCHPTDLGYRVMAGTIYNTVAGWYDLRQTDVSADSHTSASKQEPSKKGGFPPAAAGAAAAAGIALAAAAGAYAVRRHARRKPEV